MRLVFCDDNRILCEALSAALESRGHQILATAVTAAGGIAAATESEPDICVLDLFLPSAKAGLEAARVIRQHCPDTKVLVLSGRADPAAWSVLREIGVAGILRKDRNVDQIAHALDVIARGGTVFDPALPGPAHPGPRAPGPRRDHPLYLLTRREKEVLRRLIDGQSTGQMAREMNVSISTLRTYVKNVLGKLRAHSRLEAAAVASREGLLRDISAADPPAAWAGTARE